MILEKIGGETGIRTQGTREGPTVFPPEADPEASGQDSIQSGAFWLKSELFLTKIRIATFNCRPTGGNPAQRLAACLPRRVAERLLRGPLDKARKN